MTRFLALALVMASVPAAAQTVQVADSDWSYLPRMQHLSNDHLNDMSLAGLHEAAVRDDCKLPGQSKDLVDLTVPFAARFTQDGKLDRLVLKKLGCPLVEGIVAGALVDMLKGGDYRPVRHNAEGWYQGEFSFTSKG